MEPPELDGATLRAIEIHSIAAQFARTVQVLEGDGTKQWHATRKELDHGGLEAMLRDMVPSTAERNTVRDLIAWLCLEKRPPVELPEGLETQDEIDAAWERLDVRWIESG